ncbi:MAG: hypothetical protein ACLU9Q_16880 [Marvinbryantia sp.]|uniref:hypothetical protein n=1 Tax=Marvinbryantia sp. TaxID=2496532 RepID=UPI0025CE55EA|nr:hypothetical protein [uncultured Marvinbryantia sp.]
MKQYPFPDKENSMQILLTDYVRKKIPEEKITEIFDDAWAAGEKEAREFLALEGGEVRHMMGILKKNGIRIVCQDIDNVLGKNRYFCEYLSGKKLLTIYAGSVKLWCENNGFSYDEGLNIILCHEYFHYLEQNKIGMVSRRYQVPILKIGAWELGKTGIPALSEIGANAFAKTCWDYMESKKEKEE